MCEVSKFWNSLFSIIIIFFPENTTRTHRQTSEAKKVYIIFSLLNRPIKIPLEYPVYSVLSRVALEEYEFPEVEVSDIFKGSIYS